MHLLVKTGTGGGGGGGGAVATSGFSLKAALDPIEDVGKRATPWGGWGGTEPGGQEAPAEPRVAPPAPQLTS